MCDSCNDIDINTGDNGYNGYSPQLALSEDCSGKSVLQLISWINGEGTKPSFNGNIMTDAWLLANPVYLGENGFTDDCAEATNIRGTNGTNGTNGSDGVAGEAGNDGCNPEIKINVTAGLEEITCTVTSSGTACEPVFDINIPDEAFTNDTVIGTITSSDAFTNAITTIVNAALNASVTTYTYVARDVGTTNSYKLKYVSQSGSPSLVLNTALYNNMSYIQSKIVGNTMFLSFRLYLDVSGDFSRYYLEILIPNSKTYNGTGTNPIAYQGPGIVTDGGGAQLIPVISANASTNTRLKIGFYLDDSNIGQLSNGLGTSTQIFEGSLTFSIN